MRKIRGVDCPGQGRRAFNAKVLHANVQSDGAKFSNITFGQKVLQESCAWPHSSLQPRNVPHARFVRKGKESFRVLRVGTQRPRAIDVLAGGDGLLDDL